MELESILRSIYPDKNQIGCLSGVVSDLGHILQNGSKLLKIKKVIPAGSLGRNTILKGHLEVDCVYILEHNDYSFSHNYEEVINTLRKKLPKKVQYQPKKHSIHFNLERPIGIISVDLLPAFEINSEKQMREVRNKNAHYGSTTLIQDKYFANVKKKYPRFTDLVRLLKLWRNSHHIPLTSYMLELIVANSVKDTSQGEEFSFYLEVCFSTIQSFIDGRKIKPVFWDNSKLEINYSKNNLWILDPSYLSENIAEKITEKDKGLIKSEASKGITNIQNEKFDFLMNKST